jgi:ubiquinol-cytochrome c reductase cytochrome b subunit
MAVKSASGGPPGARRAAKNSFWGWLNKRLPSEFIRDQLTGYYAPKNFHIWYFSALALACWCAARHRHLLTMFHKVGGRPHSAGRVHHARGQLRLADPLPALERRVPFFIVVYLHMFRAFLYGSYQKPRELLWLFGMAVYLALMAEAFMGYVLPWGNMSFWGAQVIVNLFGTIPGIGPGLVEWIRGDYGIADATLNRFFSLHVVALPLGLLLLVALHLVALRRSGSNNPDGIEIKEKVGPDGTPLDGIPFHPYYTVKDVFGIGLFFVILAIIVFFVPTLGGLFLEAPNFEPANPLSTPEHIAPVWYFTPFYAILRAVPDQRMGALLMLLAVVSFLFVPWLDRSPVKSMRYRGWLSRTALTLFAVSFVALGYLGLQPADGVYVVLARIFTVIYFAYFWLMPIYTKLDPVKPVPERVVYRAH